MSTRRAQRIRELFDQAIELPAVERAGHVQAACDGDADLAREVMELIASIEGTSTPLDVDPTDWFRTAAGGELVSASKKSDTPHAPASGFHDADDDGQRLAGAVIGDFRILRLIGRGGMSAVFEAEQVSLGRRVAFKLLQAWSVGREARRRFVEEASILAQLKHPGIAQVIAAGAHELNLSQEQSGLAARMFGDARTLPWLAVELVENARTIVQACRGKDVDAVLSMFSMVADAVHHGHQQGFIHRDLKPANILVDERDQPKVIDFGIARVVSRPRTLDVTHSGELLGSPRYMSPEQCDPRFGPVDTRSDVYALGVVLYEALTGHTPHGGADDSLAAVVRAICEATPRSPRVLRPDISRDAAVVVNKAIQRSASDRYQSMSDFAADLRRVVAREPVLARRRSVAYSAAMFIRRRPVLTALAMLALFSALAGVTGITVGLARARIAQAEADRRAWLANLTAADAAIRLGDGGSAVRRLHAIPPKFRGWEWNYLLAQADTSESSWDVPGSPGYVTCSRSGRWIAAAYDPPCVRVFDARTHELVSEWPGLRTTGLIQWSDDESLLGLPLGSSFGVLDLASKRIVCEIGDHASTWSLAVTFTRDRRFAAVVAPFAAGMRVFNLSTGEQVFSCPDEGWVFRADFTPDGRRLLWTSAATLRIVDTTTWREVGEVPVRRVTKVEPGGLTVSPDGTTAAVICGTFVQLVDIDSQSVRAELRGHAQRVHSVSFDESGERIVTTSIDRTVRIWNAATGELMLTLLGHERPTIFATFVRDESSTNDRIIATNDRGRVRTWDLHALGAVRQTAHPAAPDFVHHVVFQSIPPRLVSASRRSVSVMDLQIPGAPVWQRTFGGFDSCVLPDRDQLARVSDAHTLTLESMWSGRTIWSMTTEGGDSLVASPNGEYIAFAERPEKVVVVRTSDGARVGTIQGDPIGNQLPRFSPDGSQLLIMGYSGRTRLFRVPECTQIAELLPRGPHAPTGAFNADGSLLAYAHSSDGITIADARTLKPKLRINDVGGDVWSVAFSPDNTRVAIGAQDRTTYIYELPSGVELLQLRDHTGSVMSLAWSSDGAFLASGGYDKRVFVYDGAPKPTRATDK